MTAGDAESDHVAGLVLAAGSGSRLGRPKALVANAAGETWATRAVRVLRDGGCGTVFVVVGAAADEVRRHLPRGTEVRVAEEWAEGMGVSLRAGLAAVTALPPGIDAVVVMLVDIPDVTADVVRRLIGAGTGSKALGRSTYNGVPGHPVILGREHWAGVIESAHGDRGARDYLAAREVLLVECGDVARGTDVDNQADLDSWLTADTSQTDDPQVVG